MYYSGVAVAIVVYDVGCRESFEKVGDWLDEFQNKYRRRPGENDQDCLFFLIGNKCDLKGSEREVDYEEGEQWADDYSAEMLDKEGKEIDIEFMEVSAKEGTNIHELFNSIADKLIDKYGVENAITMANGAGPRMSEGGEKGRNASRLAALAAKRKGEPIDLS